MVCAVVKESDRMIRLAIVDDIVRDRTRLTKMIERFQSDESVDIQYDCYDSGLQFLECQGKGYDIVFMDIEMPLIDGMTTAAKLRKLDANIPLIFITNMAQFAIKGYEVDAMGFLVKPVSYFDFSYWLKKAMPVIASHQLSVPVKTEHGMSVLHASDIFYLEVSDNNVTYHTRSGDYVTRSTLKTAEAILVEKGDFVRCNSCYLINMQHVSDLRSNSVVVAGTELMISRAKKKNLLNALTAYLGGKK